MLPIETVKSQKDVRTDFMDGGALGKINRNQNDYKWIKKIILGKALNRISPF